MREREERKKEGREGRRKRIAIVRRKVRKEMEIDRKRNKTRI